MSLSSAFMDKSANSSGTRSGSERITNLLSVLKISFIGQFHFKLSLIKSAINILLNFQEASSILETIYSDYANSAQKAFLIQEFYGADFAFFKVIKIIET